MKAILNLFIVLFFFFTTASLSYAGYDQKCLNDCFKTGHECKYCSYQCFNDEYENMTPYIPETECPLTGYYRSLER